MGDLDRILDAIGHDCARVADDLGHLAGALDSGLGSPYPTELTPLQSERLAGILARLAELGAVILMRDLDRTAAREGGA